MKSTRVSVLFLAVTLAFVLLASSASAQVVTGEMTGLVTDQSGAVVPKATITAECAATKERRVATTSDSGEYRISQMAVCVYKVSATAPGFKTIVRDVKVSIALETKADFQLQIGQRAETVTVESAAPLIEYSDQLNNYVDQERIVDLPFNGRDFNSMLGVMPGVQRTPGGGFIAVSINGARTTANNYLIDGIYNNDRYYGDSAVGQTGVIGIPATLLPNDSVAEFTVQQLPSAEYGVKGGATINVSLKSGTNNFHGDAYWFNHVNWTDATNGVTGSFAGPNQGRATPLHNNQYGADVGGPIIKDKLFFYTFFEGQRNKSRTPYSLAVPTPTDLTDAQANAHMISGIPGTGATGLPGSPLMSFIPTDPNGFTFFGVPNLANLSEGLIKVDYKLSDRHQLSGKYFIGDSFQSAPQAGYGIAPPSGNFSKLASDAFNSVAPSRAQLVGASWTFTIAPNKILVSRFGVTRFSQILGVNDSTIDPRSLGVDTGPLSSGDFGVPYVYLGYISYAGYNGAAPLGYIGGVAGYPITTRPDQTYDIAENFTWTKGKHTMKMGGNWQYAYTNSLRNRARSNLQIFNDSGSPASSMFSCCVNALTQLLLLRFDQAFRIFGTSQRRITQSTFGLFFSDEWKLTPRITVTLGLRWDVNSPVTDTDLQGGNFIPPPPGQSGPIPPGTGLLNLGPGGLNHIYNYDYKDFGPRAGLAWDVFGNGKTALRVGYALTYDVATLATIHAPQNSSMNGSRSGVFTNPNQNDFSVNEIANSVGVTLAPANLNDCFDPVTNNSGAWICGATYAGGVATRVPLYGPPTVSSIYSIKRDLKTPRIHNVQATIQQQVAKNNVVTVSYVGSFGQDLYMIRDLNARPVGCWLAAFAVANNDPLSNGNKHQLTGAPNSARNPTSLDCRRPFEQQFPNFKTIGQLNNDSRSWYHSLQASYRQQSWHGLNTQYSFTYSHCMDWSSHNRGSVRSGFTPMQNPYNPANNQASCDNDVRLNFNLGGIYSIPKFSKLGRFGEGWEIGSVFTALTGRPFTAELGSRDRSGQDVNGVVRASCIANPIYNTREPANYIANRIGNKNGPNGTSLPNAFPQPAPGTLGNCGRNTLRGPGLAQLDMNLNKTTKITEWLKVQFRWEVYNVANHLNFAQTPNQNARFSSFGSSNTTPDSLNPGLAQGGPRVMQFALKFMF